jgi:ATP-dependent Lhr-like helicase
MAEAVAREIDTVDSCLVFANTRNQVERWYQALLEIRPDWAGRIALHHGSLDRAVRDFVEDGIKSGMLRCVVCTSSLDLGVDFHPVERVFQVGSPKGVARLLQRAGRSGHQPGELSRVTCVPAHAFELVEVDAARRVAERGEIEPRTPLSKPLDVLAQHIVTIGIGTGFREESLLAEVRTTHAYRELKDSEWDDALAFAAWGGETLQAYDQYHRLKRDGDIYTAASKKHASRHRMMIGTIASDAALRVKYQNGASLGTVEENFIAKLSPGQKFLFSGRVLEFIRLRGTEAIVKRSSGQAVTVPKWFGGKLPLSTHLCQGVRESLSSAERGEYVTPELDAVAPILELQRSLSRLPREDELLIEQVETREGHHIFIFPFEGRSVHEGLSTLLAWRLSQRQQISFSITVNDYGLELLSSQPVEIAAHVADGLFDRESLESHIGESMNASELAKRQFRSIARVSGLIFQGYPGQSKSNRQLVASSSLLYDVFDRHEPDHFLIQQARREVIESRFELSRMIGLLERIEHGTIRIHRVDRPTPLAFPILADRIRSRISSEKVEDRLRRMIEELEARPVT